MIPRFQYPHTKDYLTTNISESTNMVLKVKADHKVKELPDLFILLSTRIKAVFEDEKKALYGQGEYVLTPFFKDVMKRFKLSDEDWETMPEKEKEQVMTYLLSANKRRKGDEN